MDANGVDCVFAVRRLWMGSTIFRWFVIDPGIKSLVFFVGTEDVTKTVSRTKQKTLLKTILVPRKKTERTNEKK